MYEWVHGAMNFQPGPRKNVPMTVSTTAIASSPLNKTIATLRWLARVAGLRSMYGRSSRIEHRAGGYEDPGDERIEVGEQLLQAGEVPRCLRRLGRQVRVREAAERRDERDAETEHDRRGPERDHDVAHEQVRPGEHGVVDRSCSSA